MQALEWYTKENLIEALLCVKASRWVFYAIDYTQFYN